MNPDLKKYIHQFTHLRTDRTGGWTEITALRAPHKPFLLLSIIDLFTQARLTANLIEITPELGELFAAYWDKIMPPERRGNLALPFFHLRSSKFWHLIPVSGQDESLASVGSINSLGQLQKLVIGASLDEELYRLLQDGQARDVLRTALIETYFAAEVHPLLRAQGDMHLQTFLYSQKLIEKARQQVKESPAPGEDYQALVRDQGFRRAVVRIYDHRCAFCGLRLLTSDGAHRRLMRRTADGAAHGGRRGPYRSLEHQPR